VVAIKNNSELKIAETSENNRGRTIRKGILLSLVIATIRVMGRADALEAEGLVL
jgi:hypothetical protein